MAGSIYEMGQMIRDEWKNCGGRCPDEVAAETAVPAYERVGGELGMVSALIVDNWARCVSLCNNVPTKIH